MKYKKILSLIMSLILMLSAFGITEGFASGAGDGNGILAYGIDVSSWQGKVDWQKVKNDGKTFAILRIGTGKGKDTYFEENYKNAKQAGINIGCYFYTYATTVKEAEKDAETVLSWLDGKQLEYPVYYDMENSAQLGSGITTAMRTEMCLAFLDKMSENGWYAGTYANGNWFSNYLDKGKLGGKYELWLASWMDSGLPSRDYSSQYGMWQYTDSGKVNGISTLVDLDVAYKDYPTIMKNGGFNGYNAVFEDVDEEWIITSSNGVNVRTGAGTSFEKSGFLPYGERIHITAKMTGNGYTWGKIDENNWCVLDFAEQTQSQLLPADETLVLENNLITGIENGVKVTEEMFSVSGFAHVEIKETENGFGTGTAVNLVLGDTVINTYYVVIQGDINGDAYVDAFDVSVSVALTNFETEFEKASPEFASADMNKDGVCDVFDSEILKLKVNMEEEIKEEDVSDDTSSLTILKISCP